MKIELGLRLKVKMSSRQVNSMIFRNHVHFYAVRAHTQAARARLANNTMKSGEN